MPKVHLLDYVAGNIRSLVNAIEKLGYEVDWVKSPEDVAAAEVVASLPLPERSACLTCCRDSSSPASATSATA